MTIAKAYGDAAVPPGGRDRAAAALDSARAAVRAAQKKGWFRTAEEVRAFHDQKEFEPIWDVFPRDPG